MPKSVKYYNIVPLVNLPASRGPFFTYGSNEALERGELVSIPLGRKKEKGIVLNGAKNVQFRKIKLIDSKLYPEIIVSPFQFKLARFISEYYLASLSLTLKLFVPHLMKRQLKKNSVPEDSKIEKTHILNSEQEKVFKKIKQTLNKKVAAKYLLFGPTASGKTEIYLRAIDEVLNIDGQVLALVPEISLVPQNIDRFVKRFGAERIAIIHSRLSATEKFREWQRIKNKQAKIILGPRSAIFAPFSDLKLIIIDEAHDQSFKQYDQNPRYDVLKLAEFLADALKINLILGTATPTVEDFYKSEKNIFQRIELKTRVHQTKMPIVKIVDMREEFKKRNFSVFSEELRKKIKEKLEEKKQILLFINRRGTATFVTCRDCGYVAACHKCEIPLTYHLYGGYNGLICHHCGSKDVLPLRCPKCASQAIKYFGTGTEKVETELRKLFLSARVLRMDKDSTKTKNAHEKIYRAFKNRQADILIGTQMITKGWDLPLVDLVGIISADVGLNLPDFRAAERTFELLTQVAGRTGRKENRGLVILQTYYPENRVMKNVQNHEYLTYYEEEIRARKNLNYPPFSSLIKLTLEEKLENKLHERAEKLINEIKRNQKSLNLTFEILGPAPCFLPKLHGKNRLQILLKFKPSLSHIIKEMFKEILDSDWKIDVDPISFI